MGWQVRWTRGPKSFTCAPGSVFTVLSYYDLLTVLPENTFLKRESRDLMHHLSSKLQSKYIHWQFFQTITFPLLIAFHWYFYSSLSPQMAAQLSETVLLPALWLPPFPPGLTAQEVSALVRHHSPMAESVSSCSGKMKELRFITAPACREESFRPCQKYPVPRRVVFY